MKKTEYDRMAYREKTYWWHIGRLRIINAYLTMAVNDKKNKRILNIGCGTGGTVATLQRFGRVDNVDTSQQAIDHMKRSGFNNLTKVTGTKLPFKDNSFDIIAAFDVLEHIEDDLGALNEWRRVLKPGGAVVLTVPAYQWLWSSHDEALFHKRRYTVGRLRRVTNQANLRADKMSYAIVFSLPLVVVFRFINKVLRRQPSSATSYVDVPAVVNHLFTKLLYAEAKAHRMIKFPAGTSIVARLRKSRD